MRHTKAVSASLFFLIFGCSGAEPPIATADLKADGVDGPLTIPANVAVQLSWSSENASSCQVTPGGLSGTTGSATGEELTATTTYRLSCTGPSGEAEDSVHIVVPSPPGTQIVFQAGNNSSADIYVVNADGSGLTRLTKNPAADLAPTWSGDGRQIYFLSIRDGRSSLDLYAMNPDGLDVHLVAAGFFGEQGSRARSLTYAVSPDGTRIAFGALTPMQSPQNTDLFVTNLDGSERTRIVDLPCPYYDSGCSDLEALAWSPDGQRIAYSTRSQGHGFTLSGAIAVVNADGTGQQYLPTALGRSTDPAWSPDGQRIVYSSGPASATYYPQPIGLEIINADGTGRMVLLDRDVVGMANTSPSWSPDGQSITFLRFPTQSWDVKPEGTELFAMHLDGTDFRHVTHVTGGAFAPDWNPVP
jgi:Tol biopolymer transport system component